VAPRYHPTEAVAAPARYAGAFWRVYSGFLQLAGFLGMNLERHVEAQWTLFRDLVRGNRDSAAATRAF
jgi:poly(3-hydroxybutyrate) depolymerase